MKWQCDINGFDDCWVDVVESWSRNDFFDWQMRAAFDRTADLVAEAFAEVATAPDANHAATFAAVRQSFNAEQLARIKAKLTGFHLKTLDGAVVSSAKDLTPESFGQMDLRLTRWIERAIDGTIEAGRKLGEGPGLNLSSTTEQASS